MLKSLTEYEREWYALCGDVEEAKRQLQANPLSVDCRNNLTTAENELRRLMGEYGTFEKKRSAYYPIPERTFERQDR